ncbi:hypothetical protein AMTR_s00025p00066580 [Amborella trichopoda]|uniref:Pectinesterase inhibitor domain-containing protein n=1 Tax=Amborella trichopoda TaxID=13333 RepID=W1PXY6_AMBTC|nr:hypothetical protein AMTR_s00025p00066580 [Amborella trichopoda]
MTLTAREGRETMAHSLVLAFLLIQSAMASKLMENVHAIEVLLGHALSNGKESHGCYGQLLEASTQAKMVQNLVLVAHHKDALRGLESLILHLNSCTEANIDHTVGLEYVWYL